MIVPGESKGSKTPCCRDIRRQFERSVIRAGLDSTKVTPHVLRYTGIAQPVKAGIDLPTVRKISVHKILAMVLRLEDAHIDSSIGTLDTKFLDELAPELHAPTNGTKIGSGKVVGGSSAKSQR